MVKYKILVVTGFILFGLLLHGQTEHKNTETKHQWGISVSAGLNSTSTKSSYANPLAFNWSVGVVRNIERKWLDHVLQFKYSVFKETFKDLPYYYLNDNQVLIKDNFKQTNSYSMLFLGWAGRRYFGSSGLFVQGGLGFNFMLPARYKRKFSSQKGKQNYWRPNNFFVTRPEISLGLGLKKSIGTKELVIKPIYIYNFTFNYLNLVPSFHSFGVETTLNF